MAPLSMLVAAEGDTTGWQMLFLLLLLAGLVTKMWLGSRAERTKKTQFGHLGGTQRFTAKALGLNYLGGHPAYATEVPGANIAASDEWLVVEDFQSIVFKVPMVDIDGIQVETDEEVRQRFTATRMVLVGVFALALPKKTAGSVLVTIETARGPLLFEFPRRNKSQVLSETAQLRSMIGRHQGSVSGKESLPTADTGRWAPDPTTRHELRFWNGSAWTEHVSDAGVPGSDPPIMNP